jgi:hypothetical protein
VQCPTGIAAAEGSGGQPGVLPAQVLDHATGYLAAAAALLSLARVAGGEGPRHRRLSLARTAGWLTGRGSRDRQPEREADPRPFLTTLPGPGHPVRVITPPGRTSDLSPGWAGTTDLGCDRAAFRSGEGVSFS